MKKLLILILIPVSFSLAFNDGDDQSKDNTIVNQPVKPGGKQSKVYYGGNLGFRFWNNYYYVSVQPLIGYKFSPKFSVGGKLGYSYVNDSRTDPSFSSYNFGSSIFTRYRVTPRFYLHSEFLYESYKLNSFDYQNNEWKSDRVWVPFLLLGGGYTQQAGPNVFIFAEFLVDVLQDSNSPYKKWEPFVSFGANVGF
ncbi:hypothetical protein BMS3Abin03_00831 [bacterium BMS3Abin03]|nr:hypothetical protein BMS3Abin03_00831 [bacterium BMS3Abin03]HDZ58778.1 hypothetical protein [Ignavibacteriales bacterium]